MTLFILYWRAFSRFESLVLIFGLERELLLRSQKPPKVWAGIIVLVNPLRYTSYQSSWARPAKIKRGKCINITKI